jgi:hypothetical protein
MRHSRLPFEIALVKSGRFPHSITSPKVVRVRVRGAAPSTLRRSRFLSLSGVDPLRVPLCIPYECDPEIA